MLSISCHMKLCVGWLWQWGEKLQMCPPRLPATACYWTSWIFMASLSVKDPRHTASHIVGCFQSLLPGANGKTSVETEFFSMKKFWVPNSLDPKILGWNMVEQVSQQSPTVSSFLIQLPWPPCAANVFMISGQCMTCSATALVHSSPNWMISPRFPAYLATLEHGVGSLGNTDTW